MKRKFTNIFLLLLSLFLFISCSNNYNNILKSAEKNLNDNPDKALVILSEIEFPEKLEKEDKADYWRLRSLVHSKKREAMISDSLILYSLNYYQIHDEIDKMLDSYILSSEYYQWAEHPNDAEHMLLEGLQKAIQFNDSAYMNQFLHKLAYTHLLRKEYDQAIEFYKKQISISDNHFSYYIIGLYISGDSAKYYQEKSIELALDKKDSLSASHYLRNYASLFYKQQNYPEAVKAIKRTGELSVFYKDFGVNHQIMTQVYLALGKIDSAQLYLNKALLEKRKSSFGGTHDLNLIGTENINAILQAVIDHHNKKNIDVASISFFNDSIISSIIKQNAILKEQIVTQNDLERRNLKLTIKEQQTEKLFIIFGSLLIIICFLLYLYYLKRKRKYQDIEERIEILQRLIRDNGNSSNSNFFKKNLLNQLGIIKLIATSSNKKDQDLLSQIINISQETISTESLLVWSDLYPIINSVYDNFYNKLLNKYGTLLNEKEIQLCCLLRADFSSNEISAIMQQSLQTIYQRRSTIRKKIELKEKDDIIKYLLVNFYE